MYSLLDALDMAEGGDTIALVNGTYTDQIHSRLSGGDGKPVPITEERVAVIDAPYEAIRIRHSWVAMEVRKVKREGFNSSQQLLSPKNAPSSLEISSGKLFVGPDL